jgi:cytoskeletal protein CcmA (bactofilin family)
MAIWKEQVAPKKDVTPLAVDSSFKRDEAPVIAERPVTYDAPPVRAAVRDGRESVIGSELTIEGKIEGAGHVRIAGRFKGDVNVDGNLTIEPGAKLNGGVKAHSVVIGGEVDGNIVDAGRVELLESGVLIGDLKAGSLTVAAGSRMRGRAEFGWESAPSAAHRGHDDGNGTNGNGGVDGAL